MIVHVAVVAGRGLVYVDVPETHVAPDEARRMATKLIEIAAEAERPTTDEWP